MKGGDVQIAPDFGYSHVKCFTCRKTNFWIRKDILLWCSLENIICAACQKKQNPNMEWPSDLEELSGDEVNAAI